MTYRRSDLLRAEIGTVERIIAELTDDDFIERLGFVQRLEELRAELAEVEAVPEATPLTMTFRGAPVDGSRAIAANFASRALGAFIDATETITASLTTDGLRERGPLPSVSGRPLQIVGTAIGSFGFELELPAADVRPADQGSLPFAWRDSRADAIMKTLQFLKDAAGSDDESVAALVAELHPRAAAKVRTFAKTLADADATVAVAFERRITRLETVEQVRRVVSSLAESDISEDSETHAGTVLGVLPESRRFEARLDDGIVVRGVVERAITDIASFKAQWENKPAQLEFRVVRVRSRRSFVLTGVSAAS